MAFDLSMPEIEPQFNLKRNWSSSPPCDHSTMVALSERLAEAMKAEKVSVADLARDVGMTYQGIRKIVDGKTQKMDAANCVKIAARLKVNSEWLRTGVGKRELQGTPPRAITESQWALLQDFEMLPDDERQSLRETMKAKADNVRRIVADYLEKNGMRGNATDARVAESYGQTPPNTPPAPRGAGGYKKITPIPAAADQGKKAKEK